MKEYIKLYIEQVIQENLDNIYKYFKYKKVSCVIEGMEHDPTRIYYYKGDRQYPDYADFYHRWKRDHNESFHVWIDDLKGKVLNFNLSGLDSELYTEEQFHTVYNYVANKVFEIIKDHQRRRKHEEQRKR